VRYIHLKFKQTPDRFPRAPTSNPLLVIMSVTQPPYFLTHDQVFAFNF